MEKISGIIPTNARIRSVDMKNAHPVRPGVPSFGRPVGTTTGVVKDRISLRDLTDEDFGGTSEGPSLETPTTYGAPKNKFKGLAEEVTKKFLEEIKSSEPTVSEKQTENLRELSELAPAMEAQAQLDLDPATVVQQES